MERRFTFNKKKVSNANKNRFYVNMRIIHVKSIFICITNFLLVKAKSSFHCITPHI